MRLRMDKFDYSLPNERGDDAFFRPEDPIKHAIQQHQRFIFRQLRYHLAWIYEIDE